MAALASVSPWIPEDDLLLKNAVEAGASLEALAKGAVRFSRKFSVVELRDRWHSLLYEADISSEASARMVEFQLSASNGSSKPIRSGNLEIPAKRKLQSIRKLYYAMRKKNCHQPCNSSVLSFLNASNFDDFTGNGVDCQKPLILENELPVGNHMFGDCVLNDFELQEVQMDMSHHVYPQMERDIASANAVGGTAKVFHNVGAKSLEGNHPNVVVSRDVILSKFPEKGPSLSAKELLGADSEMSLENNNVCIDVPLILGDNQVGLRNCSTSEDMKPSHALPDCRVSFQSEGVSSPLPGSPLWKTIEDISAPDMPINDGLEDKGQSAEETLILPDDVDGGEIIISGYDVQSETMLKDRHSCDETNESSVILERDFVDISDSLLNFPNEDELLFMDVDEKDTMDVVLTSPNDGREDDAHVQEPQKLGSQTCLTIGKVEAIADSSHPTLQDRPCISNSEVNTPSSTSVPNPCSPELDNAPINCILNTEDPEVPCNDDIFSPKALSSYVIQPSYKEAGEHASSSVNRDSKLELHLVKKEENLERSYMASTMIGVHMLPGTSLNPYVNSGLKSELNDDNNPSMVCRPVNDAYRKSRECRSGNVEPHSTANGSVPACNVTDVALYAEVGSPKNASLEPEANPSTSDQEQYESDDDIPHFSDIEAMILEMDLCPDDQDSCVSKEVLRYQHDNAKRTIIRLEQCAKSSVQRAMSSRGALAILYGRHFKHYIKKTEVILGRATDDIDVDIDLGREGRANKISRRQALIKMEGDGSFSLKNIGKSSILLNGREIATGQVMNLKSSSLIEIRDLSFVFEINHKPVTQFLAKATRKGQDNGTTFEWLDERVS